MKFQDLQIAPRCLKVLERQGITTPTPIQEQAIPVALEGRDVVAIAQTGTGKTLGFALPALTRLADTPKGNTAMLILAPTRELAQQGHDVIAPLAHSLRLTTTCVYGGVGMYPQAQALRRGATIVVATPGRLLDHIQRGNTRFRNISVLVLDEADRMLDMGFLPDIRRIIGELPTDRQTMMFSATFPKEIAKLTTSMQRDPVRIETGPVARPADAVRQSLYAVATDKKVDLLTNILKKEEVSSTVVFVRTKRSTDRLAKTLSKLGFKAEAIHGDHPQNRRRRAIEGFRRGRHQILVATDVAARGLDVPGISHVINYDVPGSSDDYIHRIGRTARASAEGDAITFVSPHEGKELSIIERALGRKIDRVEWEGQVAISNNGGPNRRRRPGAPGGNRNWRRNDRSPRPKATKARRY